MFCRKCGKEINDRSLVCPYCGCHVSGFSTEPDDKPSPGFAVLGFFIPLIGLILYLVYSDSRPLRAKSAGKGAIIGFITKIIIFVAIVVIYVMSIGSLMYNMTDSDYISSLEERETETLLVNSVDVTFGEFIIKEDEYLSGYYDTGLTVTVKNKSKKRCTYFIDIEAVDENGTRLGTDSVYADALNSGQDIKLTAFEFIDSDKIEDFKNAEFKVLKIWAY